MYIYTDICIVYSYIHKYLQPWIHIHIYTTSICGSREHGPWHGPWDCHLTWPEREMCVCVCVCVWPWECQQTWPRGFDHEPISWPRRQNLAHQQPMTRWRRHYPPATNLQKSVRYDLITLLMRVLVHVPYESHYKSTFRNMYGKAHNVVLLWALLLLRFRV